MATIADVIIYSLRDDIRGVASDYCKQKQISSVHSPMSPEDCVDTLNRFPKGLLIIDGDVGNETLAYVLGRNQKTYEGRIRPILLVVTEVSAQTVTTAGEYGVSQIYAGNPEPKAFGSKINLMLLGAGVSAEIKRVMQVVTQSRSEGKLDKAIMALSDLHRSHPHDLKVATELADCYIENNDWKKAKYILEKMQVTNPPYLRGIHLYARCLMADKQYEKAHEILSKLQMYNPDHVDRLTDIGNALLEMDRVKEAYKHFDKAIKIDEDHAPAKTGKGQCLLIAGQVNEALSILKEVSTPRELASIFNLSAVMNMRNGKYENGMHLYNAAAKVLGKNNSIHARLIFNMGMGYRRWNKNDKAVACFEQAIELDPNFKKSQDQIEQIKALGGEASTAKEHQPSEQANAALDFDTDFAGFDFDDDDDDEVFGEETIDYD